MATSRVAGVRFAVVTSAAAVELVCGLGERRPMATVVTANVDHVVLWHREPAFRLAVDRAALRLADGAPIVALSRWLGRPLPERVTGADLLPAVAVRAAERGLSIGLCGGAPGVAEAAADRLRSRSPDLRVVLAIGPSRAAIDDPATIETICAARPDILFVAFGAPTQELWLERHRDALDSGVGIGVGAAFDFLAGVQRRAPRRVQAAGLEWAYRLLRDPRRLWRRYLVRDPAFAWYALRDLRTRPLRRPGRRR